MNNTENNKVNSGLPKIENDSIKAENVHLKAEPVYFEISWQTYRLAAFVLFALSFGAIKYIIDYFKEKIDDKELLNILKIISFFFILNFGSFLFINVYYKYRKSIKGAKGPKGDIGKRGNQGDSSYCNICEKKTGSYRREYNDKPKKEEIVESVLLNFDKPNTKGWKLLKHNVEINGKSYRIMTPSRLGPGSTDTIPTTTTIKKDDKPIIGVSASYDINTGEIYSIMYIIDGNKTHNTRKYKYTSLNKTPYGLNSKKGTGAEFKAPPNSAVNRIEMFHNGDKIVSLRFYCANIFTGDPVMVLDPSTNKMRKFANIGAKVSKNDKSLNYEVVESTGIVKDGKYYPVFISEVEGFYNNEKGLYSLGFKNASIYQDGFSIE